MRVKSRRPPLLHPHAPPPWRPPPRRAADRPDLKRDCESTMSSSSYKIIVRNLSQNALYFYVFQKRATFQPPVSAGSIFSSSLGCQSVGNYQGSGAQIVFGLDKQIYAGAISTAAPIPPTQFKASISPGVSRFAVSTTSTARPIALSDGSGGGSPANFTELTADPLALSTPLYQAGIPAGAFAIKVPAYTPTPLPELVCGVAAMKADQTVILSSFIAPVPNATLNCTPEQIFFVKTGYKATGDIVDYDESNSARCDFTTGFGTIIATYNSNGIFSTQGGP
ncbi:hypothetical protein [Rhizobium sp. NPDC090279]|uniref:hypothetical protein n=1 Tax=Rhizobium sp. NPDC090279 TaxID=3364499 RepID=UPI00383A8440